MEILAAFLFKTTCVAPGPSLASRLLIGSNRNRQWRALAFSLDTPGTPSRWTSQEQKLHFPMQYCSELWLVIESITDMASLCVLLTKCTGLPSCCSFGRLCCSWGDFVRLRRPVWFFSPRCIWATARILTQNAQVVFAAPFPYKLVNFEYDGGSRDKMHGASLPASIFAASMRDLTDKNARGPAAPAPRPLWGFKISGKHFWRVRLP